MSVDARASGVVPTVAIFTFEQLLWSPRTLAMGALAALPIALALIYRALSAFEVTSSPGFAAFSTISSAVGFSFVAPVLALFYASGAVSDAVEAGSMTYFITRPLPRSALLAGQMLGSYGLLLLLFVPSLILSYYICLSPSGLSELGSRFPSLLLHATAAALGLLAYNGLFSLAGTALRRPLLAGLFFVFGWQAAASIVPGSARYFTIAHYLHVLVPGGGLSGALASLGESGLTRSWSLLVLVLIGIVTHALAMAIFSRKEIS